MKTGIFIISFVMLSSMAEQTLAQGLWQAGTSQNGNKAVFTTRDVGIGISSPKSPLDVKGQILGDSLHIFGVARFGNTISINAPTIDAIGSDIGKIYLLRDDPLNPSNWANIRIGIGTQSPVFTLHLAGDSINTNGDILSVGKLDTSAIPTLANLLPPGLTGPRFIWYAGRGALRAGEADAPNWDSDSIGTYSVVILS